MAKLVSQSSYLTSRDIYLTNYILTDGFFLRLAAARDSPLTDKIVKIST